MKRHRSPSLVAALVLGLSLGGAWIIAVTETGCAGTIQTTQGPRPTTEVVTQDGVADTLAALDLGYKEAVRIHDDPATVAKESAEVHAKARATLITQHDGLTAAWNVLIAWKKASASAYSPRDVIQPLVAALPSFLALAVDEGAMTQAKADEVSAFVRKVFP